MIRYLPARPLTAVGAFLLAIVLVCLISVRLDAAESTWLSGDALDDALRHKISITWSNIPVRRALESLSKTQNIAVMLDRRVDPDQKIELAIDDSPLNEALARIASRLQIQFALLDGVVYFGPASTAQSLRTIAALRDDEVTRLPPAMRSIWKQTKPWKWEKLSAPRGLVSELASENGLKISDLEKIPADLWAGANLPLLSLSDRLTLVLAQFDLTFQVEPDGATVQLVPIPTIPMIERSYLVPTAAQGAVPTTPQSVAEQLRQNKLLAGAQINVVANKLVVRGRMEDQDVVRELLNGHTARRTSVAEGRKVYTLRVELPIEKLLAALGQQMGIEIQFDRPAIKAAGISLETKVQVDVKDVSADELFKAVLDPVGLTFTRHGSGVEITPK
jgi:hypothetical protein